MTQLLVKTIADFATTLVTKVAVGDTTATLTSATDSDSVALPTGTYGFTIDRNNSAKEHFTATLTGTALTNVKTVTRGTGVGTAGFARKHRKGAEIIITDHVAIKRMMNVLDGTTGLDSATPLAYDAAPTLTPGSNQIATVAYADAISVAGAANATTTTKGIVEIATQAEIDAGTSTGATGASIVVRPDQLATSIYNTQLPSSTEKAALVGTSGTAGSGNKYVTDADTATAATANKVARRLAGGNITVVTESQANNSTNAASTAYVDTAVNRTFAQPIVNDAGGSGAVSQFTTATGGFSTTEPLFCISSGSSTTPYITRYIKQTDGSIVATHRSQLTGATTGGSLGGVAVAGNYVYAIGWTGSVVVLFRWDKADLNNGVTMTISGTALANATSLFSDGTNLYNCYTAGSAKKYTISGTTATSSTDTSFTSMSTTDGAWCDGTYVYQIALGSNLLYKWALAGGSRTTGTSIVSSGQYIQSGTIAAGGGVMKDASNTTYLYTMATNVGTGVQAGKIIPVATF